MEKPFWEGKEYSFFSHKKCEYFPVIRVLIRRILTACSVTVRCTRWERNAAGISVIQKTGSRTARAAWFPTDGKITDISPENTESLRR